MIQRSSRNDRSPLQDTLYQQPVPASTRSTPWKGSGREHPGFRHRGIAASRYGDMAVWLYDSVVPGRRRLAQAPQRAQNPNPASFRSSMESDRGYGEIAIGAPLTCHRVVECLIVVSGRTGEIFIQRKQAQTKEVKSSSMVPRSEAQRIVSELPLRAAGARAIQELSRHLVRTSL